MAHTYVSGLVHYVFSTKERRRCIDEEIRPKLWAYLGGIARQNGMKALAVGGTQDHVHVLLSLPATMPIAKAVQLLKGGSSRWLNEDATRKFQWQEGYAAFSVGISQVDKTVEYIRNQAEHHKKHTFQDEFLSFLNKHNIDYDPRYVWG